MIDLHFSEMIQGMDNRGDKIVQKYKRIAEMRIQDPLTDHSIVIEELVTDVKEILTEEQRRLNSIFTQIDDIVSQSDENDSLPGYLLEFHRTRARIRSIGRVMTLLHHGN